MLCIRYSDRTEKRLETIFIDGFYLRFVFCCSLGAPPADHQVLQGQGDGQPHRVRRRIPHPVRRVGAQEPRDRAAEVRAHPPVVHAVRRDRGTHQQQSSVVVRFLTPRRSAIRV